MSKTLRHLFRQRLWVRYLGKGYVVMMRVQPDRESHDANVAWSCDKWWRALTIFRLSKEGKITGPGGVAVWAAANDVLPRIVKKWNPEYELYVGAPENSKLWAIYRTRLSRRGWVEDSLNNEMYLGREWGEL